MKAQIIILADHRRPEPIRPEPAGNPLAVVVWAFLVCTAVVLFAALVQEWMA